MTDKILRYSGLWKEPAHRLPPEKALGLPVPDGSILYYTYFEHNCGGSTLQQRSVLYLIDAPFDNPRADFIKPAVVISEIEA